MAYWKQNRPGPIGAREAGGVGHEREGKSPLLPGRLFPLLEGRKKVTKPETRLYLQSMYLNT